MVPGICDIVVNMFSRKKKDSGDVSTDVQPTPAQKRPTPAQKRLSHDEWLFLVKYRNVDLGNVPICYLTREMCLAGVKNRGNALLYVLNEYKDENMYRAALKQGREGRQYVPHDVLVKIDSEMYVG